MYRSCMLLFSQYHAQMHVIQNILGVDGKILTKDALCNVLAQLQYNLSIEVKISLYLQSYYCQLEQ